MMIQLKLGEIVMMLVGMHKYLGEVVSRFPCVSTGWIFAPADVVDFLTVFSEACVDNAIDIEFFLLLPAGRIQGHVAREGKREGVVLHLCPDIVRDDAVRPEILSVKLE